MRKREGRRMYCGRSRVRVPRTANFSNYYRYLDGSNDWRKANLSGIHLGAANEENWNCGCKDSTAVLQIQLIASNL